MGYGQPCKVQAEYVKHVSHAASIQRTNDQAERCRPMNAPNNTQDAMAAFSPAHGYAIGDEVHKTALASYQDEATYYRTNCGGELPTPAP